MPRARNRDLNEIFGYAPDDLSETARSYWSSKDCPFVNAPCSKTNHDRSIVYGTCSVRNNDGKEVVICPKRFYANKHEVIRSVSQLLFGSEVDFCLFEDFKMRNDKSGRLVVALGQNSGKEVSLGNKLHLDWVLSLLHDGEMVDFAGLEVQAMDITGNYRNNWQAYKDLPTSPNAVIPNSEHGINWANVHKRLIPQLIRKGGVFAKSNVCTKGLHFVLPEVVYRKFEEVVGVMEEVPEVSNKTLSVHTYDLGTQVLLGQRRCLRKIRTLTFSLKEFSDGFISGPNLPSGEELEMAIQRVLKS
ncbi:NotI family restriction endonuclease [Mariniblastus sp.]|jgi:hypothetical protein|nr:NotI family restriction endonuclease [Mariniblastus sp.]